NAAARPAFLRTRYDRRHPPLSMATVDEQQRGRIEDDLRGFIKGDILFDDLSRTMYSTDASIFQMRPLGVVVPRDEEDVQGLVRYAAEKGIPIVPRGAGTGVAGESLGHGIIVDISDIFAASSRS